VAYPNEQGLQGRISRGVQERARQRTARTSSPLLADTPSDGMEGQRVPAQRRVFMADSDRRRARMGSHTDSQSSVGIAEPREECAPWATEPAVGRVANGIPARVDRLKGLGNAIVPQIATWIGHRILEHERRMSA
jgi:DNA (cytosine-5)-methyltransferase 1